MNPASILRTAICAAIGVFLLAATPLGLARDDDVIFTAYNLKNYLRMDRRIDGEFVENALKPDSEIVPLIHSIKSIQPDILGICEIGSEADLRDFSKRLRNAGIEFSHADRVQVPGQERSLALLSRFPIVATAHQTDLFYLIDEEHFPFQRGILDITLKIDESYRLRLLGVHLKSKRPVPEADQALMRRNEAHLLRLYAEKILESDPGINLLVFGDFNETRNEPAIKAFQGRYGADTYLRDIQVADTLGYRWTYYWSSADQYSRIDYVFVSKGLYPEINLDSCRIHEARNWLEASDHRPLVISLTPADREVPRGR